MIEDGRHIWGRNMGPPESGKSTEARKAEKKQSHHKEGKDRRKSMEMMENKITGECRTMGRPESGKVFRIPSSEPSARA
jgi:hypothetical protein